MKIILMGLLTPLISSTVYAGQYNPEMLACRQDFEKHCFTVEEGGGRQMKCLYNIRDKIDPACATIIKKKYERYVKLHKNKKEK